MLGPPSMDMLERGARSKEFLDGGGETALTKYRLQLTKNLLGNWRADIFIPQGLTLERSEEI